MKITGKKILALALLGAIGLSISTPAEARWYDGHGWHRGHAPVGWVFDPRLHYYVYAPVPVAVVPPGAVVVQPAAPPPQVVYAPAPVYAEPPVGVNLVVHAH